MACSRRYPEGWSKQARALALGWPDGRRDRRRARKDRAAPGSDAGRARRRVRGLIRDPDQADDLRQAGIEPVVFDLEGEEDLAAAVEGAEAVVFAAGAGPGSGAERKRTMDLDGAVKLIEAAKETGIGRYLMISSMGAGQPAGRGRRRLRRVPAGQGRGRPGAGGSGLDLHDRPAREA